MTPQEKAEHLVQEYFNTIANLNLNWRIRSLSDFKGTSGVDRAKEFAITLVDKKLINNCDKTYWQEVKQEIKKL